MENMKMSELFDLPLQRAVNELAIVDKNDCVVGWADAFSGEAARDCIVESINSHDRLVEENAELKQQLHDALGAMISSKSVVVEMDAKYGTKTMVGSNLMSKMLDESISEATHLLNK